VRLGYNKIEHNSLKCNGLSILNLNVDYIFCPQGRSAPGNFPSAGSRVMVVVRIRVSVSINRDRVRMGCGKQRLSSVRDGK